MSHAPDQTHTHGKRVTTPVEAAHPLDPLTADEIDRAREILVEAGHLGEDTRVPMLLPLDPDKREVEEWRPGAPLDRRVIATLLDRPSGESAEAIVSLTRGEVDDYRVLPNREHPYGQPQVLLEEFEEVGEIVKADPGWRAAMERRGLGRYIDTCFCSPLAPGYFPDREDENGHRMLRSLTYLIPNPGDSPWAHPVEGLIALVNLTERRVVKVEDEGDVPVPMEHGNYGLDAQGPARTSLKPIDISMPEGPSFSVDGGLVQWENWKFRVGFNAREGLVLNTVSFRDGDEDRPVLTRASVPEMVVPYGDPNFTRYWISYFDAGEYLLGKSANSLALGCDCLGVIHYFDGFVADDHGHAHKIPQVICMHEEDYGIQWKHTDLEGKADVRRSRRLVVSYFATVGNYDYGFFWYFYLDGSIQVEAKATGVVFAGANHPGSEAPHGPEIAPGIFTPVHQHIFCARLDTAVDGEDNTVHEVDVRRIPMGSQNPYGNAFTYEQTQLRSELEAQRMADNEANRVWEVRSAHRTNHVGRPTAFHLIPEGKPVLMADPESTVYARANFATKHLWATQYAPRELYPAGDYPNQHAGWAGLPSWTKDDRSLDGEDVVLWHCFGPTHVPRPEDWPVMPVDYSGFWFKPYGFLDRNPTMDLPSDARSQGACAADDSAGGCCSGEASEGEGCCG
ncbi:primary-amine oxidase [Gulosibacter sp. 10]|uniref:primary-amine oxidase n=1 Tax=Gulosibacter sp. 10 TaxID=1255570 RepID=UPI00097EAE64|nr:primary-amine oxidase [Gulosibacter sp. 10]SJM62574.1 Monoamine oxidase [Gulosibacter sp. 10]